MEKNQETKLSAEEQAFADSFVECPHCGSQLCYHQNVGDAEALVCMKCGFTTSNLMKEGSETEKAVSGQYPTLYKDLRFVDKFGYVWYPAVVTVPGVGMVYIDGSSTEDWEWAATPMRKLTRKERRSGMYKENQEYLAIPAQTKKFGKDGYILALSSLGLLGDGIDE